MDNLERAIRVNGVTHLVFNKIDVLDKVGVWKIMLGKKIISFKSGKEMRAGIMKRLSPLGIPPKHIYFSVRKDRI